METILIGTVDRTIPVFIPDPASTTGAGKTGLAAAAITVTYTRYETDNDVVHNDVTSSLSDLSALTDAHTDWGWKEVNSTLSKGQYRLDLADALFAAGAWYVVVQVTVTSGTAAATPKAFKLVAYNELDGVRMGLTALPNANADAPGGLPISDAGGLDLDAKIGALTFTTANKVDATVPNTQKVDVETIKSNPVVNGGTITFPTNATVASTTNITAGTITTTTNLTNLPAITANWLTAAGTAADFGAEVADAVWDEALAGHAGAGSAGAALSAAGSAGDPWSTLLPGAYGAGTAGHIVGTAIPDVAPGSAGGLLLAGSNAATTFATLTVSGATTLTGNVSMAAGCNITQSSANTSALVITGNGTGHGTLITSGSGATGDAVHLVAASTNGHGQWMTGTGSGEGLHVEGGATAGGASFEGGGTSGPGAIFSAQNGNSAGVLITGAGTGPGIDSLGGGSAPGTRFTAGASTFAALQLTGAGITPVALTATGNVSVSGTTTLTGAVSLGSTLGVTGTTTLAALTTTGTVTFNAFTVSGATTLTGAVTAADTTNGSLGAILADLEDGGRLDLILDAALADTNELQTDWADGGRLDLLLDATLADTNELQTDWVNGGRLDLILDARASQTSVDDLPTNAELTTALGTADDAVLAVLTTVEGKIDTIDTVVDAVKLKTDLLPEGPSKNTQFTYVIKMVDSTDHVTPKTGLTVTMTRSLDGAAFGAATGTVTEISTGHYKVVASAADMNGDLVTHRFVGTDADDFTVTIQTTA